MAEVCQQHGEHGAIIRRQGEDIAELFESRDNHTNAIFGVTRRTDSLEKATDEFYRRLKNRDEELKILTELTYGVQDLAKENKKITAVLEVHTTEIAKLKGRPGEIALSVGKAAFFAAITTGVGIYIGALLRP